MLYLKKLTIMKKNYELVLVLDTNFSSSEISETKNRCEKIVWTDSILNTDDIWLMTTAYPIRAQNQAYYVSYLLQINPQTIPSIENELRIMKWLAKFFIYTCRDSDHFVSFSDMQKRFTELFPIEEELEDEDEEENGQNSDEIDLE